MRGATNWVERGRVPTPIRTWQKSASRRSPLPHPATTHQRPQRVRVGVTPSCRMMLCRRSLDGSGAYRGKVIEIIRTPDIDLATVAVRAGKRRRNRGHEHHDREHQERRITRHRGAGVVGRRHRPHCRDSGDNRQAGESIGSAAGGLPPAALGRRCRGSRHTGGGNRSGTCVFDGCLDVERHPALHLWHGRHRGHHGKSPVDQRTRRIPHALASVSANGGRRATSIVGARRNAPAVNSRRNRPRRRGVVGHGCGRTVDPGDRRCARRLQRLRPGQTAVRYQLSAPGGEALEASKTLTDLGIRDGTT